ncbi:signal recognition particle-docking protein FtsY [Methanolapillus millepedarum]|uniref:Signal recognition particle receptor FtsY n=1 Tax=Methanolapillus millepedarum TaxID=3028296 RepID=A0AA96V294_9EURY|nr:Signal recognition particle receptor FtsY [Methanosarcinaceae archaeon Ac7]
MFGKLKEKLQGFTKSLNKTIDEKAVELDQPEMVGEELLLAEEIITDGPEVESASEIQEAGGEPEEEKDEEEVIITEETVAIKDDNGDVVVEEFITAEIVKDKSKKEKVGFFGRAKALIFDREVILDDDDLEGPLMDLQIALLESDLALSVTDAIVASVKDQLSGTRKKFGKNTGNIVEEALRKAILDVMSANVFDFDEFINSKKGQTAHVVFVGINGTGKTTSIAKIANRLQKQGKTVTIAAGDTFRAGAIDQIQIHADRLGVKTIRHQEGSDPAAVIYDALQYSKAHKIDVLLSDTAGRMHTNVNLMAQLEKICRVGMPDLIIFVDEATAGNDAVERASQYADAVPISGTILTKLDADSKGGAAISIAYITQKPILFFGIGQNYDDLMKFDPVWFVNKIFED